MSQAKIPIKYPCYHYEYLPYKEHDLYIPCGYCNVNKRLAVESKQKKQKIVLFKNNQK